jgi:hypothetical protein
MADAFGRALDDLGTVAERAKIDSLCMMAEDALSDPEEIARLCSTLLQRLARADQSRKLPMIYAIDAIAKRMGLPYQSKLSTRIVSAIADSYDVLPPSLQHKVKTMVDTWLQAHVFPGSAQLLQQQLASRVLYASGKRSRLDYEQAAANLHVHRAPERAHVPPNDGNVFAAHLPAYYPQSHPAARAGYGVPFYAPPAPAVYASGGHPYESYHGSSIYEARAPMQQHLVSSVAPVPSYPSVPVQSTVVPGPAIGGTLQSLLQKLRPDSAAAVVDYKGVIAPALAAISKVFWMAPGIGYNTTWQPVAGSLDPNITDVSMSLLSRRDMTPISILYGLQPLRCSECTMRFQSAAELQQHQDIHRTEVAKRSSLVLQHRNWYIAEDSWVHPANTAEASVAQDDGMDGASETGASTSDSDTEHVVVVRIPNATCAACGEPFKRVWDDDRQQYVYTGAVQVRGQLFHTACATSLDPFKKR